MKAIKLNGTGGVEVLQYTDEPDPTPGPNEVLVEVAAAGVNFMDIGERRGMIGGGYKPTILGVEGAGRILEVGSVVHGWIPGQRVAWVFVRSSYAQRIVAHVDSLVKLPDDIDDRTSRVRPSEPASRITIASSRSSPSKDGRSCTGGTTWTRWPPCLRSAPPHDLVRKVGILPNHFSTKNSGLPVGEAINANPTRKEC